VSVSFHLRRSTQWLTSSIIAGDAAEAEGFRPYRRLAMHVLARAVRDLIAPDSLPRDRDSARAFFAHSRMLPLWCRIAAIDPHCMADRAAAADAARVAQVASDLSRYIAP
jgi:hypothetical protein